MFMFLFLSLLVPLLNLMMQNMHCTSLFLGFHARHDMVYLDSCHVSVSLLQAVMFCTFCGVVLCRLVKQVREFSWLQVLPTRLGVFTTANFFVAKTTCLECDSLSVRPISYKILKFLFFLIIYNRNFGQYIYNPNNSFVLLSIMYFVFLFLI